MSEALRASEHVVPYLCPVKRHAVAKFSLDRWRQMGYYPVVLLDGDDLNEQDLGGPPMLVSRPFLPQCWPGYPSAINAMLASALQDFPAARVFVIGGEDMHPEPRVKAATLAELFLSYFRDTFGVMQPTGDPYGNTLNICGSPWVGRALAEAACANGGVFHPGYWHYYADQELHDVLALRGLLQKQSKITQYHAHWGRSQNPQRPPHLHRAGEQEREDKALFERRKAERFPGYGWLDDRKAAPIAAEVSRG